MIRKYAKLVNQYAELTKQKNLKWNQQRNISKMRNKKELVKQNTKNVDNKKTLSLCKESLAINLAQTNITEKFLSKQKIMVHIKQVK